MNKVVVQTALTAFSYTFNMLQDLIFSIRFCTGDFRIGILNDEHFSCKWLSNLANGRLIKVP